MRSVEQAAPVAPKQGAPHTSIASEAGFIGYGRQLIDTENSRIAGDHLLNDTAQRQVLVLGHWIVHLINVNWRGVTRCNRMVYIPS
jgi:hypothetical protein